MEIGTAEPLAARLSAHAKAHTDRPALVFLPDPQDITDRQVLTYGQVDRAARALAIALSARGYAPGDRMLLLYPPGPDFMVAFAACQYGGFIAVPVPLPDGQRHRNQRLASIVENSGATVVLTVSDAEPVVLAWTKAVDRTELPCLNTDEIGRPGQVADAELSRPSTLAQPATLPPAAPDQVAFLQYTSGSTADPRGTAVTHANLSANAATFLDLLGADDSMVFGGWLPMHHDMGLVGHLLTPLYAGATTVMMPPTAFLRRPVSWLRMIDKFGLHMSAAPNFAYDLCTRRVSDAEIAGLDLSRWRVAAVASEPVLPRTIEAFTARFAAAGLSPAAICPGYGLAETTMVVSLGQLDRLPTITAVDRQRLAGHEFVPVSGTATEPAAEPAAEPADAADGPRYLVGCGPIGGCDLRIVDPDTLEVCVDGHIGEIWLRGPSVTQGYWDNPSETALKYDATTSDGQRGFLRTGDLGWYADDQLYITGRLKEVLIVSGQNLYPQDLEAEARLLDDRLAVGVGAAFTLPVPHEEVVLVHECRGGQRSPAQLEALAQQVQVRIAREFGVTANVALVRPGAIPRTTSGKIQRRLARHMFETGQFAPTAERLTLALREHHRTARPGEDNACRVQPPTTAPTTCVSG